MIQGEKKYAFVTRLKVKGLPSAINIHVLLVTQL